MKTSSETKGGLTSTQTERLVDGIVKIYEQSLVALLKELKIGSIGGTYSKPKKVKVIKEKALPKKESGYQVFLDVLKHIGRPAMTREIASRLKIVHPEIKMSKKLLMQQLYNSASFLSKEGKIDRNPVGKRMFEYSLKEPVAA